VGVKDGGQERCAGAMLAADEDGCARIRIPINIHLKFSEDGRCFFDGGSGRSIDGPTMAS
jgi:hypothetical protein